jgi:hypothetical protein
MGTRAQATTLKAVPVPTHEAVYTSTTDILALSTRVQHLLRGRDTLDPKFFLASISPSWSPKVVVISRGWHVAGVVYAKERKVGGIPTGLIFSDTTLDTLLTDGSLSREQLFARAVQRLLMNRRVRGLRLFIPPDAAEDHAAQSVIKSQSLDGSCAAVDHHAFLRLPATYESFVAQFGKHTRRNFRYYRRAFEAAGGEYRSELSLEEFRRASLRLSSKEVVGANMKGLDRALNMLAAVKRPLLTGLRMGGEFVSVLGGWHEPDRSTVFVQLNDDRDHADLSLSVVLRSYVVEELIARKVPALFFWAGVGDPYLRQCEPVSTVCVSIDRSSFSWRTIRRLSENALTWAPMRVAGHLRWIVPNAQNPIVF